MEEVKEEINEIHQEQQKEVKKKGRGVTRERMLEVNAIRSEKAQQRKKEKEELDEKKKEIERIQKDKINFEYEQAQKLKEAIEAKRNKIIKKVNKKIIDNDDDDDEDSKVIKQEKAQKVLYKTVSRDILKDKYLEEAKRRVMMDLFS